MTTDDKEALARRAVKCKGWRWMAGMLLAGWHKDGKSGTNEPREVYRLTYVRREPVRDGDPDPFPVLESGGPENFPGWGWPRPGSGWLPDLDDPATLGCLLALVREALGAPTSGPPEPGVPWVCVERCGDRFVVRAGSIEIAAGTTEAEALVVALEAAP